MTEEKAAISNHPSATENREMIPLSESEEQFRLVLEASPDGFIILRSVRDVTGEIADFQIEYTNSAAAKGVNRTPEELLGQYLLHLFPDCKTSGIFTRYVTVAETGISTTFELFHDSKDLTGWFRNVVVKLNDGIAVSLSNITERKQAELALQQQEQHFRIALQTAKLGSWEHDLITGVLTCSAQCKANFGLPPDAEFTHETLFAALHPDDRPLVQAAIMRSLEERIDYEVEERCYHPDGSLHWLIVRGQLVYDSKGTPIRMVGVTLDITERKQFEESLQAANQRISNILESITDAFVAFDRDWRYTYVNQEAARMLGRSPEKLLGRRWQEVFSGVQQNSVIVQQFERAMAEQTTVRFEAFSFILNRWLDISLFPSPEGLAMYFRDTSERKRAEEELRQREAELRLVTNALPVLISFVDTQQRYRFNNQKYEEWFENPAIEVYGKHLWEVLGEAAYETIRPYVEQVLAGQEVTFESKVPYKDGGTRFVSATYVPRVDRLGNVEGFVALVNDITQRQRAEEALRTSEERLRLALMAANQGLYDLNVQTGDAIVTPEYAQMLGYHPDEFEETNAKWRDRLHPDDVTVVYQAYEDYTSGKLDTYRVEFRQRTKLGDWKWILSIGKIVSWDSNGQALRMLGTHTDITDRKHIEQVLRQNEEQARLAIKVGRLGTWRYNLHTDLVELDERMREIWGEPNDAEAIPLPRVMERIHPHDREGVALAIDAALAPGSLGTYEMDYRIIWDDGTQRWVSANGQVQFEGEGESRRPIDFFGTALDITDRKQAEEALRNSAERLSLALTAAKLGDWSWNAATDIVTFSQRAAEIFGIPPDPCITWTQIQSLLHENDRARARLRVEQAITKQEDYDIEYQVMHPDGTLRWVAAKGRAQYDPSGHVLGMLGVVQDITARKQAEQEREQLLERERAAREQAETANRIKDEFLAVLSHELRSPLNPILGWARLLQTRQFDRVGTKRALETIERNAKLQTQLIDDLLDISRILRGKMVLNVCSADLLVVIDAALETVRLSAEAKDIEIQKVITGDIGSILGDSARLQQIVWNLLSNAVKFTPHGGRIEIRLEQVDTNTQIQVKDTGIGITPEFLPHVFEYFRQEDGTTTRKFGGLGLGLAIVRYFTELHGGTVKAESSGKGLGATFTISLPIPQHENGGKTDETVSASDVTDASPLANLRILVVDDEADMRELIFTILQQTGAEVRVASSAFEALEALDVFKPDVLISDIGMPEMDGYELMHQLRSLPPKQQGQIPAIALTAYAGEINQKQALAAGFQRHIAKPIEPEELVKAIIALMN